MQPGRAFWREPMVWLVLGLPLATLLASAAMIALALRDPADASGSVTHRIAQMQMEDLSADREAARRGLQARFHADAARGELRIVFEPDVAALQTLELALRHPTRADSDRIVPLRRDGLQWHGQTRPWAATQAWDLQLVDGAGVWRLRGRLMPASSMAVLTPQVSR